MAVTTWAALAAAFAQPDVTLIASSPGTAAGAEQQPKQRQAETLAADGMELSASRWARSTGQPATVQQPALGGELITFFLKNIINLILMEP